MCDYKLLHMPCVCFFLIVIDALTCLFVNFLELRESCSSWVIGTYYYEARVVTCIGMLVTMIFFKLEFTWYSERYPEWQLFHHHLG